MQSMPSLTYVHSLPFLLVQANYSPLHPGYPQRRLPAFGYRQPMRLDSATATLNVPVGRLNDGTVIRETREASLSPSGRQQDFELGYTFLPSNRTALQFNLVHTLEPGHNQEDIIE